MPLCGVPWRPTRPPVDLDLWPKAEGEPPLHLHARRIVIPHPDKGVIDVTAPMPPHMRQSWNLIGFDDASAED